MTKKPIQITSREEALRVIEHCNKVIGSQPKFYSPEFAAQTAFILDKSPRKAAQCTRRAGKSKGAGLAQLRAISITHPGSTALYLALTKGAARAIYWDNVLKELNEEYALGASFNESRLEMTLPKHLGGGKIMLGGADSSTKEMEKFLGGKYSSIIIDEAGSWTIDVADLIEENLEPCTADYKNGWVGIIGTPTRFTKKSYFFDVTTGRVRDGWKVHKWGALDNPFMRENFKAIMDRKIANNPRVVETPAYRRMYLNEWVVDDEALVYRYRAEQNLCPKPSKEDSDQWINIIGVDLGYNDATAFVVCSYREYDRTVYIRHAYKKSEMIISQVAQRLEYYVDAYRPQVIVVDNAAKQAVEEMKQRYGLPLMPAEKRGKADFIELMNSEFQQGYIQLVDTETTDLQEEYDSLIWDDKAVKRAEHPDCENHCADAALYAWRRCLAYMAQNKPKSETEEEALMKRALEEWQNERDAQDKPWFLRG